MEKKFDLAFFDVLENLTEAAFFVVVLDREEENLSSGKYTIWI